MISDWSRRRASSTLAGLLWVLTVASAAAAPPVVTWNGSRTPEPRERTWLAEDAAWLASLPAAPSFAAIAPDSLDLLRRLRPVAQAEAATGPAPESGRAWESLLRDRWADRGYLDAAVVMQGGRAGVADTARVDPGPRYRIGSLEIGGDDFADRRRLIDIWLPRPGDDLDPALVRAGMERILSEAGERGYPFARWVVSDLRRDRMAATVALDLRLLPGRQAHVGPITSDLPPGPGRAFLVRAAGLRTGSPFRESQLRQARERLVARDLYLQVDEARVYLTAADDTVGIHFPVVARTKINRLQVVLGLSRKSEGDGSRLSGQVDLELPNIAGTGRRLAVAWLDDGADRSRFGFGYREPLAFGTPLDTEISLEHEVLTDVYTRFRADNGWSLPVVALWGVELGFGWDRATYPTGSLANTRRVRVLGALEHRRGDRTRSGWTGRVGVESAWRSAVARSEADTTGTAGRLGEAVTQRILLGDLGGEYWVAGQWSVAARASYRQLQGGEETAPLSEHFRFGGANTLRGWREDEFHGTTAGWAALELRIGRPRGSRLYTFCDVGYFEFSALDPLPDDPERRSLRSDWPWGFGLGLLARTPGGDLSLAVGFPETVDFQVAKLHVSLMESF